eukprot:3425349-Pleurochrysis_carterae.AAC.1
MRARSRRHSAYCSLSAASMFSTRSGSSVPSSSVGKKFPTGCKGDRGRSPSPKFPIARHVARPRPARPRPALGSRVLTASATSGDRVHP